MSSRKSIRSGEGFRRAAGVALVAVSLSCAISQQQEVELGSEYAAQLASELPVVKDPEITRYLTNLGNRIAKVADTRGLQWHFTVVDSREVNAFAVPGGWIYVNRGLIERAENMSQLAGVIGHEIGHVTRRHSVQQMQQAQGANAGVTVLCTLTKVCESGTGQTAINLGGTALFAKFSRSDEAEADEEAVKTTIAAGIDPTGIPEMFEILRDARGRDPSALDAFFATHPLEEDRIARTRELIAARPAAERRNLQKDDQQFQAFRKRLQGLPAPPAVARNP